MHKKKIPVNLICQKAVLFANILLSIVKTSNKRIAERNYGLKIEV